MSKVSFVLSIIGVSLALVAVGLSTYQIVKTPNQIASYVQDHKAELKGDKGDAGVAGEAGKNGSAGKVGPAGKPGCTWLGWSSYYPYNDLGFICD